MQSRNLNSHHLHFSKEREMNSLLPKSGRIFILLQRENLLSSRWNCPYRFLLFVSELYYSAGSSFLWDLKLITRSVFANDKFVKLLQDVSRQRKIFEKRDYASLNIFLNFNIPSFQKREGLFLNFKRIVCLNI